MKPKFLTTLLAVSWALTGLAGGVGNGGDGIVIGSNTYLLDFLEAGIEASPYFDESVSMNEAYFERVKKSLPLEAEVQKLSEISALSPVSALVLLQAIETFSFRLVSDLVNVQDEDSSLQYDPKQLVQLAVRRDRSIQINRELWKKLPKKHQAGLIFHEMVYAMVPTVADGDLGHKQPSFLARQLTGYLFHPDLQTRGLKGLATMTRKGSIFPISELDVVETNSGICLGLGVEYHYNLAVDTTVSLLSTEASAQVETSKLCSEAESYLLQWRVDVDKTEVQTIRTCQKFFEMDFVDYQQRLSSDLSSPYQTKSRVVLKSENIPVRYPGDVHKRWDLGVSARLVNHGTRRRPSNEVIVDQSKCPVNLMSIFREYQSGI